MIPDPRSGAPKSADRGSDMAWDFETDAGFQEATSAMTIVGEFA
jgi:hypothetical protein